MQFWNFKFLKVILEKKNFPLNKKNKGKGKINFFQPPPPPQMEQSKEKEFC